MQQYRGEPLRKLDVDMTLEEQFESKVNRNGPVNLKTGTRCHTLNKPDAQGYSVIKFRGKTLKAYRVAWEIYVGPIPKGHQIDHDDDNIGCRNKACVNVEHLKPTITNHRRKRTNTSGEWGIFWDKLAGVWYVQISLGNRGNRKTYSPAAIGLPSRYKGDPPPAAPPQDAIDAREKLRVHLGLPE